MGSGWQAQWQGPLTSARGADVPGQGDPHRSLARFHTGSESSETLEVVQKNLAPSGPRIPVHAGTRDNSAAGCPD